MRWVGIISMLYKQSTFKVGFIDISFIFLGTPQQVIEEVAKVKLLTMLELQEIFDNFSCKICYSQYTQWNTPTVICQNHHLVCKQCWRKLMNCPYCKQAIFLTQVTFKQLFGVKEIVMKYKDAKSKLEIQDFSEVAESMKKGIKIAENFLEKLLPDNIELKKYVENACLKPQLLQSRLPKIEKQFQKLKQRHKALTSLLKPIQQTLFKMSISCCRSVQKNNNFEHTVFDLLQNFACLKSRLKNQMEMLHDLKQKVKIKKAMQHLSKAIQKLNPKRKMNIQ